MAKFITKKANCVYVSGKQYDILDVCNSFCGCMTTLISDINFMDIFKSAAIKTF